MSRAGGARNTNHARWQETYLARKSGTQPAERVSASTIPFAGATVVAVPWIRKPVWKPLDKGAWSEISPFFEMRLHAVHRPQSCPVEEDPQVRRSDLQFLTSAFTRQICHFAQRENVGLPLRKTVEASAKDLPQLLAFQQSFRSATRYSRIQSPVAFLGHDELPSESLH